MIYWIFWRNDDKYLEVNSLDGNSMSGEREDLDVFELNAQL